MLHGCWHGLKVGRLNSVGPWQLNSAALSADGEDGPVRCWRRGHGLHGTRNAGGEAQELEHHLAQERVWGGGRANHC